MSKRPDGLGCVYLRGKTWWLQYCKDSQRFNESAKTTNKKEAENLLKVKLAEIVTGQFHSGPEKITIKDLCVLVHEDYKLLAKRSVRDVEWRNKKHLIPMLGSIRAIDFGTRELKSYISKRRHQGAADATINRELSIIRRGFKLAFRHDPPLILREPFIPKLEEDNVRQGFLEPELYATLRDALPPHLKAIFVVGYHVGTRLGELKKLQWSQVDLVGKEIRLEKRQTKGKRPRTLPIYGEMEEWLRKQREGLDKTFPDCPWVFYWMNKKLGSHFKGWNKACIAAGLPGLHFHDLRRSAVRNMERAGIPRNVAMSISGHRTESVYRRYDIVTTQDIATAATKLGDYLQRSMSQA